MSFEPKHELPITSPNGDGPWPSNLQLPIQTRGTVDASKGWYDNTRDQAGAANAIVDYYSSSIGHFVQAQRRNYATGNAQVQRRFYSLPGLTMAYENYQGQERLSLTVYPESAPPVGGLLQDINYDGYLTFILYDPKYPNPVPNGSQGYPRSYDLYLNGYLLYKGFQITQVCQGFVAMFGLTALRCQSLVDKQHMNPFEQQSNGGLVNKVLPPRAQVEGHDDLVSYVLFNFTTTMNPVYNPVYLNQLGGVTPIEVNITHGVQFFDPKKSPLNTKKGNSTNYFGVTLSQGLTQGTEDSIGYFMFGEFYSRDKARGVSRSWNKTSLPGETIIANDKPLFWGNTHITSYTELTPGENAMGFDLFADNVDGGALSPADLNGQASNEAKFGKSILPAADDALVNYVAEVAQIELAFSESQLPLLRKAQGDATKARMQVNDDELNFKRATSELLALDDQIALFETLDPAIYGPALANDKKDLPIYKQNVAKADELLTTDIGIMNMADDAFERLAAESPTLPPVPTIQDDDIDHFRYRTVTVSGSDWTFGGWQGGD